MEKSLPNKSEVAKLSEDIAFGILMDTIKKGIYDAAKIGLRAYYVTESCYVPKMMDKQDFINILNNTSYQVTEVGDGTWEIRWR